MMNQSERIQCQDLINECQYNRAEFIEKAVKAHLPVEAYEWYDDAVSRANEAAAGVWSDKPDNWIMGFLKLALCAAFIAGIIYLAWSAFDYGLKLIGG